MQYVRITFLRLNAAAAAAAAKSLQPCPTVRPQRWQPTRLPRLRDSPGKNTGVGCHFLLQCVKVKSESEVAQLCLTLSDPMDCSLPCSSVHGIFQARVLEWVATAFSIRLNNIPLIPPFVYVFICQWILGCFHLLATVNNAVGNMTLQISLQAPTFNPLH